MVSALFNPAGQFPHRCYVLVEGDGGRLRHRVRVHVVNTQSPTKDGLDYILFRRVVEPGNVEDDGRQSRTWGRCRHAERVVSAKASGLRSKAFAQPGPQK